MGSTPGSASRKSVEIELKGKKYTVLEPNINELAMFESYVRSSRLALYLDAAKNIDSKERQEMVQAILKTPIEGEDIQAELQSLDGMRYMLFLVMRHNPGITHESMGDLIDLSNLKEVSSILDGFGEEETNPPLPDQESR